MDIIGTFLHFPLGEYSSYFELQVAGYEMWLEPPEILIRVRVT